MYHSCLFRDLERLLLGTYNANGSYAGIVSINSLGTDETRIGLGNRGQGLQAHSFTLNTGSGEPAGVYNSAYDVLDNANRVLRSAEDFPTADGDEAALLNQIRGEALAIRAWQHFDLLRMFAPSFDSNAPGVPLAKGSGLTSINRFNINAVRALQARVALYSGDFANAITIANQVVTDVPLVSGQDYIDMFRIDDTDPDAGTSETIFQIERDQFDGRVGTIWSDINEDVFFSMSVDLYNDYLAAGDDDDRFLTNLDLEEAISERTIPFVNDTIFDPIDPEVILEINPVITDISELIIGKYLGSTELISLNNIKVFRSSEMVLISAEANARMGNLSAARDDINTLRMTRSSAVVTPDTYGSQEQALTDILAERRIELAFEGHRLLDLKRFGEGVLRIDPDCSGDGRPATTCDLTAGNFRFTFPIPQAEIFANDGISDADQNPGY